VRALPARNWYTVALLADDGIGSFGFVVVTGMGVTHPREYLLHGSRREGELPGAPSGGTLFQEPPAMRLHPPIPSELPSIS
jgi:hypothetical protein